jgi:RecJ-like exonuclease
MYAIMVAVMMQAEHCPVCSGKGTIEITDSQCPFCNGTGERTRAAESYMKVHICQCIFLDRKNCPLCGKKCHHNTPNRPKILISPM